MNVLRRVFRAALRRRISGGLGYGKAKSQVDSLDCVVGESATDRRKKEDKMRHKWFLVLACGWVLMQPPPKLPAWERVKIWLGFAKAEFLTLEYDADLRAPLSAWEYIRPYDTAKECEEFQSLRSLNATKDLLKRDKTEDILKAGRWALYMSSSRCVPATVQLQ